MKKLAEIFNLRTIDYVCYEIYKFMLIAIAFLCGAFFSWVLPVWSIGCLIHFEFKEGILVLSLWVLSIIIARGSNTLLEKID